MNATAPTKARSKVLLWCAAAVALFLAALAAGYIAKQASQEAAASAADRRIVDAVSLQVEPQLRSLSEGDPLLASCGKFESWEPHFWVRTASSMFDEHARWSLGLYGTAHFEKADIPVHITIGRGSQELVLSTNQPDSRFPAQPFIDQNRRLYLSPQTQFVIRISGGASHPELVEGPPHRDGRFSRRMP